MVYKFECKSGTGKSLELERNGGKTAAILVRDTLLNENLYFQLDEDQIYDLIGALHTLQAKCKKWED